MRFHGDWPPASHQERIDLKDQVAWNLEEEGMSCRAFNGESRIKLRNVYNAQGVSLPDVDIILEVLGAH